MALAIMLLGALSTATRSEARNLTDALVKGYRSTQGSPLVWFPQQRDGKLPFCPCTFAQDLASALSTATSQTISQDVPVASVAPAFSYHFNPDLNIWDKSTGMLGPLFAERALTLGKGKFNFNIGYAYVEFDEINGASLNNLGTGPGVLLTNGNEIPVESGSLRQTNATQLRTRLDIQTHVFAPTFRYGITDRLDVSLVIPILNTSLRIDNTAVLLAEQSNFSDQVGAVGQSFDENGKFVGLRKIGPDRSLQPASLRDLSFAKTAAQSKVVQARSAESASGVGDLILRAKYNFWREESGGAAFGLSLLLPSGEEDDLQGTGETHVTPSLFVSQVLWDRLEPHVNLGLDFNANDVERSSFLYVAGATVQVWQPVALMVDVIGRSEFNGLQVNKKNLAADGLRLNKSVDQCTAALPCSGQDTKVSLFPENFAQRNDIVNFAFGLRYALGESGSIYFGGVVPLNDDGFRSDFIPSGGVEYTF
jgi:hypothetical protein